MLSPSTSAHFDPATKPCVARVRYDAPVEAVAARIPAPYRDELEACPGGTSVRTGAPGWDNLAFHLLWAARDLGATMTVLEGNELRTALRALAHAGEAAASYEWTAPAL